MRGISIFVYKEGTDVANTLNRSEITSADANQSGFEYQYLYFILRLLQMSFGEEVGYEALDDVHVVTASKKETLYIQVKHTVATAKNGKQASLPTLSPDLWKTLSNWSKLIADPVEGRSKVRNQLEFVKNSSFVLVVNRKTDNNNFISEIEKLITGTTGFAKVLDYIKELRGKTKNTEIQEYIDDVIALSPRVLEAFLKKTVFQTTGTNLFKEIREEIRKKMTEDKYIDDVFGNLYLQLKEDFFDRIQKGQHQVITYSEWIKKYRKVFNNFRTTLLPFREYSPILPEHLEQQFFVQELVEIGAVDMQNDGLAEIAELTEFYMKIEQQLDDWYNDGEITLYDKEQFHKNVVLTWKRIHQSNHRTTSRDITQDNINALSCYDNVMEKQLILFETHLGLELSNGEFIKLANEEKIGWKFQWSTRGKLNGN